MVPTIQMRPVPIAGTRPYRPLAWTPAPMAGVERPKMGQSAAGIAAIGAVPMLLGAAWGAGTAWVGFSTGSREKGLLSILGYVVGSLGALTAVFGTLGAIFWVGGVSMAADKIEERIQPALAPALPQTPSAPQEPFSDEFFQNDFFR